MIKFAKAPVDGGRGVSAVVFMALAAMLCASAPAASCTWTNNVVNTPATAYNWSDSGNWKDGMVPNAYDKAVLPSTALYINLPDGVVDLTAGGEVVFTGHVDSLRPGRYALVTATSLAFGGEWTCESPSKSLSTSLRASGDTVYLNVATVGTMLLFK
jgi:hypothetical protein